MDASHDHSAALHGLEVVSFGLPSVMDNVFFHLLSRLGVIHREEPVRSELAVTRPHDVLCLDRGRHCGLRKGLGPQTTALQQLLGTRS